LPQKSAQIELTSLRPHVASPLSLYPLAAQQEIGNLLYGYGQLRFQHPELLDAVASGCGPRLHEFTTQDLCMTVWSYGAVGYCPSDTSLFESACRVLLQRKERLLPLQITCVIKGFSRSGYQPPAAFMQQMSQLAQVKLSQFSPLEYSQLLWAYSVAGYRDVALFEAVVAHAIQQLHSKSHTVTKTTVDTMLVACQGVGFWPQLLVDTAEMNGLYVKTQKQIEDVDVQPLAPPVLAAADAASAAAQATAVAAEAALAAATAARAAVGAESEGSDAAGQGSSNSVGLAAAAVDQPVLQLPAQQQQQQEQVFKPLQQPRQPTRLDGYGLQRPQAPQRQQQQQYGQPEQQQPSAQQQQQQQLEQQGLDHPLLRSQLLPPPALPKVQPQWHGALPAAAVGSLPVGHSNGTSLGRSIQGEESSSLQDSSGSQQQLVDDTLVHPIEQS
jgi:hypothetical protein